MILVGIAPFPNIWIILTSYRYIPKNKKSCKDQADSGVEEVSRNGYFHIKNAEEGKYHHGNNLLDNL